MSKKIILGITGASGTVYAERFLFYAKRNNIDVEVIITKTGEQVMLYELEKNILENVRVYAIDDFFAPPATGSSDYYGMVILPCSMGTLGKLSAGIGDNLLTRAADVCLKERRNLVIVPREMPFNTIHLENMLRLKNAGACILCASPHFYKKSETIENLVDTVILRVFSQIGITVAL